jgi:tRNA threonylcarbamoyladenosine dehydratase
MHLQKIKHTEIDSFKAGHPGISVEDKIDLAVAELFDIAYPSKKDTKTEAEVADYGKSLFEQPEAWGEWIYYPWLNKLVHFPPKAELRALRTSRNRNLITAEEQAKLYDSTILIIGMSVGSNVVEALVGHGTGSKLVLVDMDILEPSNLNRIRAPYHHIGLPKVEAISRKVWEIDPYIEIVAENNGLNENNIGRLIHDNKVDVIVDEMDDLRMKILLREAAKAARLPVVMAADDGDGALIDIERYDLNPDTPIFMGQVPADVLERIKAGGIPRAELGKMIGQYFVGLENIPARMFESLAQVGKTLPSWPQLGGAAALAGVSLAYAIRRILLDKPLKQGRTLISLEEKLDADYGSAGHQAELQQHQQMMKNN